MEIANLKQVNIGSSFVGSALLRGINIRQGKNGSFAAGLVQTADAQYPFKIWGCSALQDGIYSIKAKWDQYKDTTQIIISEAIPVEGNLKDYTFTPYDMESLKKSFNALMGNALSSKGKKLLVYLLNGNKTTVPALGNRFGVEFAAINHHDNVYGGLFAHSYKVAMFINAAISSGLYRFPDTDDFKDIVLVGGLLHDIGKVIEYHDGAITEIGKRVSHRTLACERLVNLKKEVTELYGDEGYYVLMSIFAQHHGQYEETPRTKEAMLVHLADSYDATLTYLSDGFANANGGQFYVNGFNLI